MEEQLQIRTFGTLEVHKSGSIVTDFPSRKAEALLVYLAVERNIAHRRESLFTLLWPGMPEKSARHNLRQVLYALRKLFSEVPGNAKSVIQSVISLKMKFRNLWQSPSRNLDSRYIGKSLIWAKTAMSTWTTGFFIS